MDFKELLKKIDSINEGEEMFNPFKVSDETVEEECGDMEECGMGECGGDMPQPPMPHKQDSADITISLNGHGSGGIRDIMDILKGIEGGAPQHGDEPLGKKLMGGEKPMSVVIGDEYENSVEGGSDTHTFGVDAITQHGDDLSSKSIEKLKPAGGGNPMAMHSHKHNESLINHLNALYEEIKAR